MARVHRSRIDVLRILMHLDIHGVEATTKKYGTDKRTLAKWQAAEPSGWEREEELNRLVMGQAHLDGKVRYRDAVVGRGIAWDKLDRLRRRDDARRQAEVVPEPADAFREAVDTAIAAFTPEQIELVRDHVQLALWRDDADDVSESEGDANYLRHLSQIAALSPSEVAVEHAAVLAELEDVKRRPAYVIEPRSHEGVAERVAIDVTPSDAPTPPTRPEVPASSEDAPGAWSPWARTDS